jgi:hypothetical protein
MASEKRFSCDGHHSADATAALVGESIEGEIAMTSFAPLMGMVRGNRAVGRQVFDVTEEFRAHAAECQELANRWHDEAKRQYEELARQWLKLAELAAGR